MEERIEDAEPAAKTPNIGLGRLVPAFRYAFEGVASAWRTEAAFRQEALVAMVAVPLALALPVPALERALLAASVLFVMAIELVNSSIESAIDRISTERHPLSKRAKDTGSAAVMLAIVIALIAWTTIAGGWLLGAA